VSSCFDLFAAPGDMSPSSSAIILAATAKQEAATANLEECSPMTKCLFKRQNWISENNFLSRNTKLNLEHKVTRVYIEGRTVDIQPIIVPKRDLFAFNHNLAKRICPLKLVS
jgi:hypothetical protein